MTNNARDDIKQESLLQVLHQRQLVEKRAARDQSAADKLNVENLTTTHDVENESNDTNANPPKSPRTFKLPKWPGACPGSPLSPHSHLKMLAAKPTSPTPSQVRPSTYVQHIFHTARFTFFFQSFQTFPVFYSPPIQQ